MVFSDILAQNRHLLDEGSMVIMTVEADKRDDQLRLSARSFRTLEEAERQDLRQYNIKLASFVQKSDLAQLANIINNGGQAGQGDIRIHVRAGDNIAVIKLPKQWWLPPTALKALGKNAAIAYIATN